MWTYKITVMYDGSRYNGWQRQDNTDKTIQGIFRADHQEGDRSRGGSERLR